MYDLSNKFTFGGIELNGTRRDKFFEVDVSWKSTPSRLDKKYIDHPITELKEYTDLFNKQQRNLNSQKLNILLTPNTAVSDIYKYLVLK